MNERKLSNYTVVGTDMVGGDYYTDRVWVEHVKAKDVDDAVFAANDAREAKWQEVDAILCVFEGHLTDLEPTRSIESYS